MCSFSIVIYLLFLFNYLTTTTIVCFANSDRILLNSIQTLTLRRAEWTRGRRGGGIPQIQCVGGSAAGKFEPEIVQCYNRGSDGIDIQWECKADMSDEYRFGEISISCEGFDSPNDAYILKGSCGLEYILEYTEKGQRNRNDQHQSNNYGFKQDYTQKQYSKNGIDVYNIVFFVGVGLVIYFIYTSCISNRSSNSSSRTSDAPPPSPGWRSDDHRPPPSYDDATKQGASRSTQSNNAGSSGASGFWTGLGLGGLGGYLFGANSNRSYYGNRNYGSSQFEQDTRFYGNNRPGGGGFSSFFGGGGGSFYRPSNSSGGYNSSTTRTASGFGGTKRR